MRKHKLRRLSHRTFHRSLRRVSRRTSRRDAENPRVGEIFESANGTRWEVVNVTETRVDVKRAGHRSSGPLRWARSVLRTMKGKKVSPQVARKEAQEEVPTPPPSFLGNLFGNVAPDPSGRRRRKRRRASRRRRS